MDRPLLPLADTPGVERADAARNRRALLAAAMRLVDHCGVDAVTMDAVAEAAGVGKGTVFRRFDSRAGLMAAVLDHSESQWQAAVISGPAPLGPGAAPLDRLIAFGRTRLELNQRHGDLIIAATEHAPDRAAPPGAAGFAAAHVRHLLAEIGVEGDLAFLAQALLAPIEVFVLRRQVAHDGVGLERVLAGWEDLVRRVVA